MLQATGALSIVEGEGGDESHYVNLAGLQITERPEAEITQDKATISADGIDAATFSFVDETPAAIEILGPENQSEDIAASSYSFSTELPGFYEIVIEQFPRKAAKFTVTAES